VTLHSRSFTTDAHIIENGVPTLITDAHITFILRRAAGQVYKIDNPTELALWASHSIRIGACVALYEAGANFLTLK